MKLGDDREHIAQQYLGFEESDNLSKSKGLHHKHAII